MAKRKIGMRDETYPAAMATYMLRHHIRALQGTIEDDVHYSGVLQERAQNETESTAEATHRLRETYEIRIDRLRCAIDALSGATREETTKMDIAQPIAR